MPATPKRHEIESAIPEARFLDDVVAANARDLRVLHRPRLPQELLAEHMRNLGHRTWTSSTVSEIERGRRTVSASELLGLALALGAPVADLLDPRGVSGRQTAPVDYVEPGGLPTDVIGPWVRGEILAEATGPGTFALRGVPGHEDAFKRASESLLSWNRERQEEGRQTT